MKWFKHDSKASHDAKLQKLQMKYGMEGYGLYWYCLEMIASNVEPDNLTFELEHDSEIIAYRTGIHYERVQEMMTYMIRLGLFEENKGVITCLKLARRLDDTTSRNPDIRKIRSKLFPKSDGISKKLRSKSEETPTRVDKSRVEENRSDKQGTASHPLSKRFKKPTVQEIQSYCFERQNRVNAQTFYDFYESKGWKVGKNPMKDWKAAIHTWEHRDKQPRGQQNDSGKRESHTERLEREAREAQETSY
ncbi:Lin1244/Lin1753 domain-containing protein [Kangiella sediminilitoris]|uniref:Lin1244/Lin1753-like N-terminal domain-containing protein n=1 Tax=Kangiella sediminilitoris TaxID=1144748 RepID=A0A1B3B8Y8_9GAMM|nr:Lin1244/Lin1753 domain-containing protein [Kangiella sediminilitoris]AOE49262.1 hypothetical protein KS2013_538 [Kangiella sediminilitoris]